MSKSISFSVYFNSFRVSCSLSLSLSPFNDIAPICRQCTLCFLLSDINFSKEKTKRERANDRQLWEIEKKKTFNTQINNKSNKYKDKFSIFSLCVLQKKKKWKKCESHSLSCSRKMNTEIFYWFLTLFQQTFILHSTMIQCFSVFFSVPFSFFLSGILNVVRRSFCQY